MFQVMTARQAADLIRDGDCIAFNGQVRFALAEKFISALEERFLETGSPRNLRYLSSTCFVPMNKLAPLKGLIREMIAGHWVSFFDFAPHILNNELEAYNVPQGIISLNYSAAAARIPGFLTRAGLHTYTDPRFGSGALNEISQKKFATPTEIDGKEYLFYHTIYPDVCILRGTTCDPNGNITAEKEMGTVDMLSMAQAAHNNGGKVIVQVERLSETYANPHEVLIPGCLVDAVYTDPDQVMLDDYQYEPLFSGETRLPEEELPAYIDKLMARTMQWRKPVDRFIARRAALEVQDGDIINLGTGLPLMLALEAHYMGKMNPSVTFTIESGVLGGVPVGFTFGASVNVGALIPQSDQFRFYEGHGLSLTAVGVLEIDKHGNVNVIRKGNKIVGVGGFSHVTASPKRLLILTRFMVGSGMENQDGKLVITDGKAPKFCEEIEYVNFSADIAREDGQEVLYITERCVFRLAESGLELIEIAPGLDLERDILAHLSFRPAISPNLKEMPAECFDI